MDGFQALMAARVRCGTERAASDKLVGVRRVICLILVIHRKAFVIKPGNFMECGKTSAN